MTNLASYLLNRALNEPARRTTKEALEAWLTEKGVTDPTAPSGSFASTSGSSGTFQRDHADDASRRVDCLRLRELDRQGNVFLTSASLIEADSELTVYVSLSGEASQSAITPLRFDPKCPRFLRALLKDNAEWKHGGTLVPSKWEAATGEDAAASLVSHIRSEDRTLPVVIVSELDGDPILPELPNSLARELLGLARVVEVNDPAAWRLTAELGKEWSCYGGAVRLYWPRLSLNDSPYDHPLWTASRLLSDDPEQSAGRRFPAYVRRRIMSVSALSIAEPRAIGELLAHKTAREFQRLRSQVGSSSEYEALAEQYAKENESLRREKAALAEELATLRAISHRVATIPGSAPESFPSSVAEPESARPNKGETRFYKKTTSKDAYDVMVRIADCGHSKWQGATKAEKAKKGLAKLEGSKDWNKLWHCGTCTGGGVWKVRW